MQDQTNVTKEFQLQFKHFVWSNVFISPFPDYESADNWRRKNWPDADHLPFTGKTLEGCSPIKLQGLTKKGQQL